MPGLVIPNLLRDTRPGRHLSSLGPFLSERGKISCPLHLKSDEKESSSIGPVLSAGSGSALMSSRTVLAFPQPKGTCPEAAEPGGCPLPGAEMALPAQLRWEFPPELGSEPALCTRLSVLTLIPFL